MWEIYELNDDERKELLSFFKDDMGQFKISTFVNSLLQKRYEEWFLDAQSEYTL